MSSSHVKPAAKTSRILVIPDMHVPYHDARVWATILAAVKASKPETIVIIGDFADCYAVSSHPKSLDRKADFAAEIDVVNTELDRLQKVAGPECRIIFCEGNHEDRITRYLQSRAPELGGLHGMRAAGLFRARDRGIAWVPYRRHIKIGRCSFTHDVGRCGVNTARQSLIDFGGNLVVGHSHRGGVAYQGEAKGANHFCLNVGWGGDVDEIDYVHRIRAKRDWAHGFGVVDQDSAGYSWGQFVPVISGRCVLDGVVINGRAVT